MNRWTPVLALCAGLAAAWLAPHSPAAAQAVVREAPQGVRPARLVVTQSPEITLDGRPDRLSPGARIRDIRNLLALPASLTGRDLPALVRRDGAGLVHEVWLLTEAEWSALGGGFAGDDPRAAAAFAQRLADVFAKRP